MRPILVAVGVLLSAAAGYGLLMGDGDEALRGTRQDFQRRYVDPMRPLMTQGSCDQRNAAFAAYLTAARQFEFVGADSESVTGFSEEQQFVEAMFEQCEKEAYEVCVKDHDFSKLLLLDMNIARTFAIYNVTVPDALATDRLENCMSFELETEIVLEYGQPTIRYEVKAVVPLKPEKVQDGIAYKLSGEEMPTVAAKVSHGDPYCTYGISSASPAGPVRAFDVKMHPDTVGANRMNEASRTVRAIEEPLKLLEDSVAAEKAEGREPGADKTRAREERRSRLNADLSEAIRRSAEVTAQYTGKALNKPRLIELELHPGTVNVGVLIRCPDGSGVFPSGQHYLVGFPFAFGEQWSEASASLHVRFEEKDIQGGELTARKTYTFTDPRGMRLDIILNLWHRPKSLTTAMGS